jgi:hypothetical protein
VRFSLSGSGAFSDFNNVPYPLSPLNHEHELRFSARQSRLFFDIDGKISTSQLIKAYFEMDFLGAATTANSIESNSYTPRIRHAFLSYDDTFNGWHILAGQTWSLLTQNKTGIDILPVVSKFLDLQGSVLYGQGIGRYGSAQLPDVTFARNGSLAPITAFQALVGALFHINPDLDVYAFAGIEQDKANYSTVGTNAIGLGNALYADGLCLTENSVAAPAAPTSPVSGILSNTGCSVDVKQVEEITVGFWQNLYRGPIGRLVAGMEFEYLHRTAFSGLNFVGSASATTIAPVVTPAVDEATVMSSLRFYF